MARTVEELTAELEAERKKYEVLEAARAVCQTGFPNRKAYARSGLPIIVQNNFDFINNSSSYVTESAARI
jgi:hypothetical protein